MMTKAFIFLNGEFSNSPDFYKSLNIDEKHLYCADGGSKKAIQLGLSPKEVWGDFDSLESEDFEYLKTQDIILNIFNKDKDFTDGELLISYVSSLKYNEIIVIGGFGGRIDHTLTNINLIFKYPKLKFVSEIEELFFVPQSFEIENKIGKTISFIPFSDKVTALTLKGFKYSLDKHTLNRGDSTCLSNIITQNKAFISYSEGKLLGSLSLD
ncbi:MAG: thiamine diphosphokinase [Cetobacterium sp.]